MKKQIILLVISLTAISCSCQKEKIDKPTQVIKDGVIVWQTPIWSVPHDTAYYVRSIVDSYWQFDDKVIVDTYRNKKGGLRCMRVDTGEILWEKYFDTSADVTGEQSFIVRDSFFNPQKGFLIIMIGAWGERRHVKIDIQTGETLWEIPIETTRSLEESGDYYYCMVQTSDDVCPIYRVSIDNGVPQFFYASSLPAHPNFDWQRNGEARPFIYNDKDYIFIAENRLSKPDSIENFASLLEVETMKLLVEHVPLEAWLSKVEVVNDQVFCFTGSGYKIFSMETLSFEREVKLIDWGDYIYHTFYNDKLIMGLSPNNTLNVNGHYVVDLNTHKLMQIFEGNVNPASILDDIIYFPAIGSTKFKAFNLTSGQQLLNFDLRYNTKFGVATYKNIEGKKFALVGDIGFTYCYEAI